jgi:NAD(P)-dependent dehydrogenase (short-subunit alcohol dehydrogenase family)
VNTIGGFLLDEESVNATPENLRVMMDVNLGAALWLSQAVEAHMPQRGSDAIVHVPARPGTDPTAGMPCAPAPPIGASTPPAEELSRASYLHHRLRRRTRPRRRRCPHQ